MNSRWSLICLTACGLSSLNLGCASVISGREADIAIKTNPPRAHVMIQNEKGETVANAMTPTKVSLKRSNGIFKKAPRYSAVIQKQGYQTAKVKIDPKLNPWVFGNVVLGGVIGLAADSATGAIWNYKPNDIDQSLAPISTQTEYYSDTTDPEIELASHEEPVATATDESE
jgi:hypothetical protein